MAQVRLYYSWASAMHYVLADRLTEEQIDRAVEEFALELAKQPTIKVTTSRESEETRSPHTEPS